jgi:type IV pilus assembly protein PilM
LQVDLSIFNPKARPTLGLDISRTAVKMVELTESGRGELRLEQYAIEYLPKDAVVDDNIVGLEQVTEAIQRCWKRLGTHTRYVAMSLPTSAVITKKIILPADLRETEMEVQVESEANQYIPFSLDEVNLDFQIIGPAPSSPDEVEVMIAAARKEKVEDRVACAESANLKPLVIDVESFAIHAAFDLVLAQISTGRDPLVALIDVGASATRIMVMRGNEQVYSREQAFGGDRLTQDVMRVYGMGREEAEAVKRSGSGPENYESELLRPFMEDLAMEASRALQFFFSSTHFSEVHHIVLAGGCAAIPGVNEIVAARTQVPTIIANPFARMATSSRIRSRRQLLADAPLLMVACGLALRRFDQ